MVIPRARIPSDQSGAAATKIATADQLSDVRFDTRNPSVKFMNFPSRSSEILRRISAASAILKAIGKTGAVVNHSAPTIPADFYHPKGLSLSPVPLSAHFPLPDVAAAEAVLEVYRIDCRIGGALGFGGA